MKNEIDSICEIMDVLNEVKARRSETFVGNRLISEADIDELIKEVENQ